MEEVNYTLSCLLLLLSLLWLSAAVIIRSDTRDSHGGVSFPFPSLGAGLILTGGLALTLELTVRLVAATHFNGRASAFSFGIKCKTDVEPCELEPNTAFAPEFNSFGHCAQGLLVLLLFPGWTRLFWATSSFLSRKLQSRVL